MKHTRYRGSVEEDEATHGFAKTWTLPGSKIAATILPAKTKGYNLNPYRKSEKLSTVGQAWVGFWIEISEKYELLNVKPNCRDVQHNTD